MAAMVLAVCISPTWTDHVSAVCHGTSPFYVNSGDNLGNFGREEPKVGVCNWNSGYQSRFRKTGGDGCTMIQYAGSNGRYASNCTTSTLFVNGPVFSDPSKSAPLYFCTVSTYFPMCDSGPWTNYGF